MLNRILSRIDALERRPIDSPCAQISAEEIAEGAEVHLGVAVGVLERARANGVDIFTQCRRESDTARDFFDRTYRDKDGRYVGLVIVTPA